MGHPPLENLLPKAAGSVYKLSRLAAKRSSDLAAGRRSLVETTPKTKTATIALEEIQAGMVVLKVPANQFKPEPQEPKGETAPEAV
ncbi:MAG TPA: DNA-directed RNA polymerase subunit omega [Candidatus Bathyarchaeia archaeon]|nr:DNA-directed RNA polymerase subunit omega [Candidatus Bathyarchaeia archaeon]